MNKKIKWIIIAIILFVSTTSVTVVVIQRQKQDVVMEVMIFGGLAEPDYRFIIRSDRRLISRFGNIWERGGITIDNLVMLARQSMRITLSEEDFYALIEMARYLEENYYTEQNFVFGPWLPTLFYNGYTYGNFNVSETLFRLSEIVYGLSPLSSR